MSRALRLWLAAAAMVVACAGVGASGADFVQSSASPGNDFAAAADFNTVAVAMGDPGSPLHSTVPLQATASSERGIDRIRFQTSVAGTGIWSDACEDTSAPYACDWDTAGVADGLRELRAIAVDQAGYQRTDALGAHQIENTLPLAALSDPGVLTGTEILTATASDAGTGLATLAIAYRPAGGAWTELCTGATSPRACPLDSTTLADGSYELRARATDAAGNVADALRTRTVDNTAPTGSVPLGASRGTITVPATVDDGAGSGVQQVTIRLRPAGGAWADVCVDAAAPWECAGLNTTAYADGAYEVLALVADGAGFVTTTATTSFRIDNTVPSASTLTNPGASLQGSVALAGTATDAATGSGILSWTAQYRLTGTTPWLDACTDGTAAYSCTWDSTAAADGIYEMRALATDAAGNQTGSTVLTNKRVDNVLPAVSLTDPGTPISNTVTLAATATDGGGVASVAFERSPAGANTWTNICTDAAAAYTCAFVTTAITDGSYDLRARATDNFGRQNSAVVANVVVDNAPRGVDVQTTNVGGGTAGRIEVGDTITFTWSEPIAPASILAGWSGASQAIRVNLTNNASNDRMDFYNTANTVRLNLVLSATDLPLGGNFVTTAGAFNATMLRTGNTIRVTFGTRISGTLATAALGTMTWRPSALALDLSGKASTTTLVTETGAADRDF